MQEAAADLLMGEQTWPTEEEMAAAIEGEIAESGAGRLRRKVKAGVSYSPCRISSGYE